MWADEERLPTRCHWASTCGQGGAHWRRTGGHRWGRQQPSPSS